MEVILAAVYPGLHTPSLRLPYLYTNSGGLYINKAERGKETKGEKVCNQTHHDN